VFPLVNHSEDEIMTQDFHVESLIIIDTIFTCIHPFLQALSEVAFLLKDRLDMSIWAL